MEGLNGNSQGRSNCSVNFEVNVVVLDVMRGIEIE